MADRAVSPEWAMLFLSFTVFRQKKRHGGARCIKTLIDEK